MKAASCCTTRSTTWSTVEFCAEVVWASPAPANSSTAIAIFIARIASSQPRMSIRQLESDMQRGHRVIGLAIAKGRLVADLLRGANRGFVQAMAEAALHPHHAQLSRCSKHHLQKHFAFQLQVARFLGVN